MNFDTLNSQAVAIRAKSITYDYLARELEMKVVPEYGVKPEIANKKFLLVFETCIHVSATSTRVIAEDGIEFISWGKFEAKEKILNRISTFYSIEGVSKNTAMDKIGFNLYEVYYFENLFGESLLVTCKEARVTGIGD
jgi:hypothetical protein